MEEEEEEEGEEEGEEEEKEEEKEEKEDKKEEASRGQPTHTKRSSKQARRDWGQGLPTKLQG